MHDAGDRRMHVIADRIGALAFAAHQLQGVRNELPRDRVVGIVGVDQRRDVRRDGHRITRGNFFQIGQISGGRQAVGDEISRCAQCRG